MIHFLLECALEQIDQDLYKSKIITWQVGNRPASLDTYPLIGETPISGLWLVSGTYRDGFHMSPLLGEHIAKQVLGKPDLIKHNIFSPQRNLLKTLTKEESIEEAVEHYISLDFECAKFGTSPDSGACPAAPIEYARRIRRRSKAHQDPEINYRQ
jgi:hypothetical protein